ncbi:DsbA family oxidoreductase [Rapidithrix thailandica]|uniref:DsbA family oxidoreductase n=1 Tax=Rapidithrix thailandica TaxID=413964 RepID=A0AAW9SCY6_9BACT
MEVKKSKETIKVDIVSDVVCPWCYIGENRLAKAIAQTDTPVEISWKPFQLHPDMPESGMEKNAFFQQKFGTDAAGAFSQLEQIAKEENLKMDPEKIDNIPNTIQAHRLMWWAQKQGKEKELAKELFVGYFGNGQNFTDDSTLVKIAGSVGLDAQEAEAFLNSEEGKEEVQKEEALYRNSGVSAVPSFIINNTYLVQGAQTEEVFLKAFQQIEAETNQNTQCNDTSCG